MPGRRRPVQHRRRGAAPIARQPDGATRRDRSGGQPFGGTRGSFSRKRTQPPVVPGPAGMTGPCGPRAVARLDPGVRQGDGRGVSVVIPAEAGIQGRSGSWLVARLDPGVRRGDGRGVSVVIPAEAGIQGPLAPPVCCSPFAPLAGPRPRPPGSPRAHHTATEASPAGALAAVSAASRRARRHSRTERTMAMPSTPSAIHPPAAGQLVA